MAEEKAVAGEIEREIEREESESCGEDDPRGRLANFNERLSGDAIPASAAEDSPENATNLPFARGTVPVLGPCSSSVYAVPTQLRVVQRIAHRRTGDRY